MITIKEIEEFSLTKNLYETIEYTIKYIEDFNLEKDKSDNVLSGFMEILRIFILYDESILEMVIKNYKLFDLIINKCIFSKCKCKILFN